MEILLITKKCSKCKNNLTLDSFTSRKSSPDGKETTCKSCVSIRNRNTRSKPGFSELSSFRHSEWSKNNIHRRRELRNESSKRASENLTNSFIKQYLINDYGNGIISLLSEDVIDVKRKIIKINRLCRASKS